MVTEWRKEIVRWVKSGVALREGLGFAVPYEAEAGNAAQPEGWP